MASENTTPIRQTNNPPDDSDHEDSFDPKDEINPFDWQDLEARYLSAMAECKAKEDVHLEEFESLSQYFGFWAETISDHEQKRSHQRSNLWNRLLNTSLMNLNIDIKVVEAFQNALNMLNNLSAPQHQHHA
ncbi:unnamed protein product [Aureobasidium pullulans]|nr:unnamed protein product [Aureobasidium pullulans]CAD0044679.1 unnamed protein product [Aureobasidium pullulans]